MPFGVGRYCFIHSKGNARASYKDKANSVPTSFLFMAYHRERVDIGIIIMKTYLLDILNRYMGHRTKRILRIERKEYQTY